MLAKAKDSSSVAVDGAVYLIGIPLACAGEINAQWANAYSVGQFARPVLAIPGAVRVLANPNVQRAVIIGSSGAATAHLGWRIYETDVTPTDMFFAGWSWYPIARSTVLVHTGTSARLFSAREFYCNRTGNTYRVFVRSDIDWSLKRTAGDSRAIGMTNGEAAERYGFAPQLSDGCFATLHHCEQSALGPLFEASTRYHNVCNIK